MEFYINIIMNLIYPQYLKNATLDIRETKTQIKSLVINSPATPYRARISNVVFAKIKADGKDPFISFRSSYFLDFNTLHMHPYQINSDSDFCRVSLINFTLAYQKNPYELSILLNQIFIDTLSFSSFGCCSRYNECSDALNCLHPDQLYATGCYYRKNLEQGLVFYGKNKKTEEADDNMYVPAMIDKSINNKKGKSIIDFPNDYIVMDFETTGLDRTFDEIIEIGAIKVINGEVSDVFSTLINPDEEIDEFITDLTGITNDMVADAPKIQKVMPNLLKFLSDYTIVGHNIGFDINFLCANTTQDINNNFINTLRLCNKLYKDLQHHRLRDMVQYLNIKTKGSHRAIADCEATLVLFNECKKEAIRQYDTIDNFIKSYGKKTKNYKRIDYINKLNFDNINIDESNLIYDKECVFTGKLERIRREDAMQLVVNIGGRVSNNVTKRTNYLILGNNDYCKTIKGGKSNKQKKAEQLKLKGQDIEILSEQTFYELLSI